MSASTSPVFDRYPSLLHGLLAHAARQPDALLYRVIADDESVSTATWAEFLSLTRRCASLLASQGVGPGTRVVLMLPNSMEFLVAFFATLWCGAIAVPSSRPRKASNAERLSAVLAASTPELLVCLDGDTAMLAALFAATGTAPRLLPLNLAMLDSRSESALPEPLPAPTDVALIQFTSGSTGVPKGIVISHGNLAVNIEQMNRAFGSDARTVTVSWLPTFHDAGLISMALAPMMSGGSLVLSSPQRFIRRPQRWLEDLTRYRATCTGAPNFAFDLVLRATSTLDGLDLSAVRCFYNGAETVSPRTISDFKARFARCGLDSTALLPVYGLAEATVGVAGGRREDGFVIRSFDARQLAAGQAQSCSADDSVALVSAGCATPWCDLRIVDPMTFASLPDGTIGEIWIAGPQIAQGYWQRPDETAATYDARAADGSGPWLRSGDLGFLLDDRLYISGRIKETIIVRGRNLSPDEIELVCAKAVPALPLSQIVAVPVRANTEQVGVIVECPGTPKDACDAIASAFRIAVAQALDVTLADILFVDAMSIPRTSSGKKQRLLAARLRDARPEKLLHVSSLVA